MFVGIYILFLFIRPPAEPVEADQPKKDPKARSRPLYDIPYMFEAREFLRKKLIGKKASYSQYHQSVISYHCDVQVFSMLS